MPRRFGRRYWRASSFRDRFSTIFHSGIALLEQSGPVNATHGEVPRNPKERVSSVRRSSRSSRRLFIYPSLSTSYISSHFLAGNSPP